MCFFVFSGNAPCVTGYAAKKEGLGIGGPNQILVTGGGKDDNLTQQLLDVSATNGAIINSSVCVHLVIFTFDFFISFNFCRFFRRSL